MKSSILIQLFDSVKENCGGTYKVSRIDGAEVDTEEFLKEVDESVRFNILDNPKKWGEDDVLQPLKEKWNIEYQEVLQVSY
jgi:hypothetical protein